MKIKFKDFLEKIKNIKYKSKKDWEIFLPHSTSKEDIQLIIAACRDLNVIDWHIIFPEPTEKNPEPEVKIYWGEYKEHE